MDEVDDDNLDEKNSYDKGTLLIVGNALFYNGRIVQISNISMVWTTKHKFKIKKKFPVWIVAVAVVAIALILGGAVAEEAGFIVAGVVASIYPIVYLIKFIPKKMYKYYTLAIELSSGKIISFFSDNQLFIRNSALRILEVISNGGTSEKTIVMNFDNKEINIGNREINIENAVNSNVVGGDIKESVVEALGL